MIKTEKRPQLLDVKEIANLLKCSTRTVNRLNHGKMPKSIKVGALTRWRYAEIEQWISDGCPSCTNGGDA